MERVSDRAHSDVASPDAEQSGEVDIHDVLEILSRRRRLVLAVPAVLLALAFIYSMLAEPVYRSVAQIYIDPATPRMASLDPDGNAPAADPVAQVASQMKVLTSDEVLFPVIDSLKLTDDVEFGGSVYGLSTLARMLTGEHVDTDRRMWALRRLRDKIIVYRSDQSFVVNLTVSARQPEKAVRIADMVMASYIERQRSARSAYSRELAQMAQSRLTALRANVSQAENAVEAYKKANNLVGPPGKLVTDQQLEEANSQLTAARTRLAAAQAKVKLVEAASRGIGRLDSLPEAIQSPTIMQLRSQAAAMSREEARLGQQYGPGHPAIVAVRAQKYDIQQAINAELGRIAQSARNEMSMAQTDADELRANFEQLRLLAQQNNQALVALRELERKAEASRAIYQAFMTKASISNEQPALEISNARVISPASPPAHQSWPSLIMLAGVALVAGTGLGILAALLAERWERTRAARRRAFPPRVAQPALGVLQAASRDAPPAQARTRRSVTLWLEAQSGLLGSNVLDFAEKTAQRKGPVVVIDHDFSAAGVTHEFQLADRPGLRDFYAGRSEMEDVVYRIPRTNVILIPAGRPRSLSRSAAEAALRRLIAEMPEMEQVIICGGLFKNRGYFLTGRGFIDEIRIFSGSVPVPVLDQMRAALLQAEKSANVTFADDLRVRRG